MRRITLPDDDPDFAAERSTFNCRPLSRRLSSDVQNDCPASTAAISPQRRCSRHSCLCPRPPGCWFVRRSLYGFPIIVLWKSLLPKSALPPRIRAIAHLPGVSAFALRLALTFATARICRYQYLPCARSGPRWPWTLGPKRKPNRPKRAAP